MLFDRFRLRFWLHFGTQNAPKNESKKQLNFQPILSGFWSILGASRAPLGEHFGLQKSMKKHPSSKDPSKDAQWIPKDSKMMQNDSQRPSKWSQNGSKINETAAAQGDKDQQKEPNLNANLNSNWASKHRATRCGLTVCPKTWPCKFPSGSPPCLPLCGLE